MYQPYMNFPISFRNGSLHYDWEPIPPDEYLDALVHEIGLHAESIKNAGYPPAKLADLAMLIDILVEKDRDRLDRLIVYRMGRRAGGIDLNAYCWLQDLSMAILYHKPSDATLREALFLLSYPGDSERESGADAKLPGSDVPFEPGPDQRASEPEQDGFNPVEDAHQPITFDFEPCGYSRVDTRELRVAQSKLNEDINRICTSHDTGYEVMAMTALLDHLARSDFRGVGIIGEMARAAAEFPSTDYLDVLDQLNAIAHNMQMDDLCFEEVREAIMHLRNKKSEEQKARNEHSVERLAS